MLLYHFERFIFISLCLIFTGAHSRVIYEEDEDTTIRPSPPIRDRPICEAGSSCLPMRRCRPLRTLPNWRTAGETCGSGSGPSRRVCCPRQSLPTVQRTNTSPRPPVVLTARPPVALPTRPPVALPTRPSVVNSPPRPTSTVISNNAGCGEVTSSQLAFVLNGKNATEGAWPWMVAITIRGSTGVYSPFCTGFLIDRRHVVSAAHCFDRMRDGLYSTRIGRVNQNEGEIYPIRNIVVHEGYRAGRFYNDIAILTLTRDVDFPNFNPICLPDEGVVSRNLEGMGTTVAGWGSLSPGGPLSIILQQLSEMPVVSIQSCNTAYRDQMPSFRRQFPQGINGGFICAGFPEGRKDACGGDSGAPLMLQERNRWFAIGIVSFGFSCGVPGFPGGYTRVSTHLRWIRENTRN